MAQPESKAQIENELPLEECIMQVLQHLGIDKAHFAGRIPADWIGSATTYPDRFLSLTLICPVAIDVQAMRGLGSKMLVFNGDQGAFAGNTSLIAESLPAVKLITWPNYSTVMWTDVAADHTDELAKTLLNFLAENNLPDVEPIAPSSQPEGEIAGISYRIRGSGPALILLPLSIAPSQWEPLIPRLSEQYCTITLSGAKLGNIPTLELRGKSPGYQSMVQNLMAQAQLQLGDSILDIGSGTGVVDRWLARYLHQENPITGIDVNNYLVREATKLTAKEGLAEIITFQEDNAEALSFPDNSFDLSFSSTVMEEVDADKMISEMVRVTKPGGKVAVIVRATDIPYFINLPLRPDLKAKAENRHFGKTERGCADSSLFQRFYQAGLIQVKKFPQLVTFENPTILNLLQNYLIFTGIDQDEKTEWHAARAQIETQGTFFISQPHHCAIGTKAH